MENIVIQKGFKKEDCFPNESFIQRSIETYFEDKGFETNTKTVIDLIAKRGNECWIVEAKGMTSSVGVDFNTCLGQIIKRMNTSDATYAIAIPKHEKYKKQCIQLSPYVRKLLGLHILLVDMYGDITEILPEQDIESRFEGRLGVYGTYNGDVFDTTYANPIHLQSHIQ